MRRCICRAEAAGRLGRRATFSSRARRRRWAVWQIPHAQALAHFVGKIAPGRELVRRAGVVKQRRTAFQHSRELAVEGLANRARPRFRSAADRASAASNESRGSVAIAATTSAFASVNGGAALGDHGFKLRNHSTSAFFSYDEISCGLPSQAARGEVTETAARVEDPLAARLDERDLALRVRVRRDVRGRQHLDAVDLERRRAPVGGYELDQRRREARHRLELAACPVIDRAVFAAWR